MLVVGLQGSPRRKGNSRFLLETFLNATASFGAEIRLIEVDQRHILPCKEYTVCEKKGYCPIEDDMLSEIYGLIRRADVVVAATPVFFYNMSAQLKGLIDRCQTFWARKYRLRWRDPRRKAKKGYLLSVAATQGNTLFDAIHLTMQYFYDAIDADYAGHLTYRGIEGPKDMARHATVMDDVQRAVACLMSPLVERKRILIVGPSGACASQMAGALVRAKAADRFDVRVAGLEPAAAVDVNARKAMAAKGWDIEYEVPLSIARALEQWHPDVAVALGPVADLPSTIAAETIRWALPDTAPDGIEAAGQLYDGLDEQVTALVR
jgi:multimeric flavodoxin WrbA/protein-tyrosine-phosphatase